MHKEQMVVDLLHEPNFVKSSKILPIVDVCCQVSCPISHCLHFISCTKGMTMNQPSIKRRRDLYTSLYPCFLKVVVDYVLHTSQKHFDQ